MSYGWKRRPHWEIKKCKDVFVQNYSDLQGFWKYVFQHIIPLKDNNKPFLKNPRICNPNIDEMIEKELKNVLDLDIIYPIRNSS